MVAMSNKARGGQAIPLNIVGATLVGVILVVGISGIIFVKNHFGSQKNIEIIDSVNISPTLTTSGGNEVFSIDVFSVYPENVPVKLTLHMAFIKDKPSAEKSIAISQVKNAKYHWAEEYPITVPIQRENIQLTKSHMNALSEYSSPIYAVAFVEIECGANTWVWSDSDTTNPISDNIEIS
jgi:hypothetical protein